MSRAPRCQGQSKSVSKAVKLPGVMTRAALASAVERSRAVQQRIERQLAYFAVPGGLGQLVLHRWAEAKYEKSTAVSIELAVFLIYITIFLVMFTRVIRVERQVAPVCPACGQRFSKTSASLAITTGRCDRCGAQVVE